MNALVKGISVDMIFTLLKQDKSVVPGPWGKGFRVAWLVWLSALRCDMTRERFGAWQKGL